MNPQARTHARARARMHAFSWLGAVALATLLTGCSRDCPSCTELRNNPEIRTLSFQLCVAQIPDPNPSERGCDDVDVQYTLVTP